jgi:hypothetical protein
LHVEGERIGALRASIRRLRRTNVREKAAAQDVPYLRRRGRWLQGAGFAIGRHVRIDVSEGQVNIVQVD